MALLPGPCAVKAFPTLIGAKGVGSQEGPSRDGLLQAAWFLFLRAATGMFLTHGEARGQDSGCN